MSQLDGEKDQNYWTKRLTRNSSDDRFRWGQKEHTVIKNMIRVGTPFSKEFNYENLTV